MYQFILPKDQRNLKPYTHDCRVMHTVVYVTSVQRRHCRPQLPCLSLCNAEQIAYYVLIICQLDTVHAA